MMPVTLTGNVNIHLNSKTGLARLKFLDIIETFDMVQRVSVPTHQLGGPVSTIATGSSQLPAYVVVEEVGLSDHMLLSWSITISSPVPKYATISKRV